MGQKSQYQISMRQRIKRKKRRVRLAAKGEDLNNNYYGKYCIKAGLEK